jgi:WD40 repeat protein
VWDEESGQLHRELEGFPEGIWSITALATFLSADGQQPRLVAGTSCAGLRVYDPEAGSVLHRLQGHGGVITDLACIASSSAAPHHPRLVSASQDRTARVWDGETGEMLAEFWGHDGSVKSVAVWKEHTGGHDRIATSTNVDRKIKIWDGEALTLLQVVDRGWSHTHRFLAFESGEGPQRLPVALGGGSLQVYDPEDGRRLHSVSCYVLNDWHLFESAEGRQLLATLGVGERHPHHPYVASEFIDVWDLGRAPARAEYVKPAHHLG